MMSNIPQTRFESQSNKLETDVFQIHSGYNLLPHLEQKISFSEFSFPQVGQYLTRPLEGVVCCGEPV